MQTVRIVPLSDISRKMQGILRNGQHTAADVWNACCGLHKAARCDHTPWPGRQELQQATKGQFALHSQSIQMVCHAFLANVDTTRKLRQQGSTQARYPYKEKRFYPLLWPAQAMSVSKGRVVLPMGRGQSSVTFKAPMWLTHPTACKILWNGEGYEAHISVETEGGAVVPGDKQACVDLGQIHLAAVVTNTGAALLVSGRGIRAEKRLLSKQHGKIATKRARCKRGSRRWKKLQAARAKVSNRAQRRIRDARHKATRHVINFCVTQKVGSLYVGNPHGVRNKNCGRKHNQRMSQWEYGTDIRYLRYKAQQQHIACSTGTERGTSSQCPQCRYRQKPKGRVWQCSACGFIGHRDFVGGTNMHTLAFGEQVAFPTRYTYLRPHARRSSRLDTGQCCLRKYTGQAPDFSGLPLEAAHTVCLSSEAYSL